jgi:hypothetical protein
MHGLLAVVPAPERQPGIEEPLQHSKYLIKILYGLPLAPAF